jgi:hypothetical protein
VLRLIRTSEVSEQTFVWQVAGAVARRHFDDVLSLFHDPAGFRSSAKLRPSPSCSGTCSVPATHGTSAAIRRIDREQFAAKGKAVIGKLCHAFPLTGAPAGPVYGIGRNGRRQRHIGDRIDVIEMM